MTAYLFEVYTLFLRAFFSDAQTATIGDHVTHTGALYRVPHVRPVFVQRLFVQGIFLQSISSDPVRLGLVWLVLDDMDWTKIFERKDVGRKGIGRKVSQPVPQYRRVWI